MYESFISDIVEAANDIEDCNLTWNQIRQIFLLNWKKNDSAARPSRMKNNHTRRLHASRSFLKDNRATFTYPESAILNGYADGNV